MSEWQTENTKYCNEMRISPKNLYNLLNIVEKAKEWHSARSVRPINIEMIERLANAEHALSVAVRETNH